MYEFQLSAERAGLQGRVRQLSELQIIGWVPTGWTYENKRNMFPVKTKGNCSIHLVPYSEHSSYSELQTYVKFLRPHEASQCHLRQHATAQHSPPTLCMLPDPSCPLLACCTLLTDAGTYSNHVHFSATCQLKVLVLLQVIPTVGVDGENADRNRRAMLKHFSRLVDSSARKAKFLSAFQKRPRSGTLGDQPGAQDGGTMTPATDKDGQLGSVKPDVVHGTDSSGRKPGSNDKPQPQDVKSEGLQQESANCMDDIQQDNAKQEDGKAPDFSIGLKQENGKVSEHASLQPQHIKIEDVSENGKLADSEAEISSCDESVKAEELRGIEDPSEFFSSPVLQHQKCSATFRHEVGMSSLCLDLRVRHVQCIHTMHVHLGSPRHSWALTCAADFEAEEEGKPDMEDAVQQLISILDPDTSTLEARQLLFRANGDIARALNLHYDDASNSGEMLPAE